MTGPSIPYVKPATLFATQGATGDQDIDGVLSGYKWSGPVTFSFPQGGDRYLTPYARQENTTDFIAVTSSEQSAVRAILLGSSSDAGASVEIYNPVTSFTMIDLVEVPDGNGDIRVAHTGAPGVAYTYYPLHYNDSSGGDVWLPSSYPDSPGSIPVPLIGTRHYEGLAHELGHALGLKHAHQLGGPANEAVTEARSDVEFSIMNYHSRLDTDNIYSTEETGGYPQTYMMLDIAALQTMYGANYGYHAGDTTYRWDPTTGAMAVSEGAGGSFVSQGTPAANRVFLTTWDGGGTDTYDMSNYATGVSIDLRPGQWSVTSTDQLANLNGAFRNEPVYAQGNVYNSLLYQNDARSLIENAIGGMGQDTLVGNGADNLMQGGTGNDGLTGDLGDDRLFGQDGNDSVPGGAGNDFASGGFGNDTVSGEAGNDLVFGDDDDDLVDGGDGDDLVYGGSGADAVYGSAGIDQVYGQDGNDFVGAGAGDDFGSGGFGNDEVHGEEGNDLLFGDEGDDGVYGEDGDDLVYGGTGNDYLTGDAGNDLVRGEDGNDGLSGGAGNDTLDGGTGADLLFGNAGDDALTGGAGADVFAFGAGDGADRILDFVTGGAEADVIAFNGGAFANFAAVLAASRQDGADVVIGYGAGDALTLANVQLGSLSAANVAFAS
jgi:serralysin